MEILFIQNMILDEFEHLDSTAHVQVNRQGGYYLHLYIISFFVSKKWTTLRATKAWEPFSASLRYLSQSEGVPIFSSSVFCVIY